MQGIRLTPEQVKDSDDLLVVVDMLKLVDVGIMGLITRLYITSPETFDVRLTFVPSRTRVIIWGRRTQATIKDCGNGVLNGGITRNAKKLSNRC